jgi:isoleucyl-tRNA synthetase
MFEPVEGSANFPALEQEIGRFWNSENIYQKSLAARDGAERFVFYEGPPTANGMPHPGHCLTRAIKDLFPRYRTMRGYLCERKAGWDTHGLPVEVEVCKELGIHSKEEIEAFGIEPFIQKCQASVWQYMQEWERLTERLGFWVDLKKAYVTYHQPYVESVWWSLKQLFDRGMLYQGHKIVWWWAQGGTALSAGEVGQGYREVADPSAFLKLPLRDNAYPDTSLLVWTTTPWTLPSNQFAAVHPDIEYATISEASGGEKLIVARDLVASLSEKWKREWTVESIVSGNALIGLRYRPPYDCLEASGGDASWKVISADFVTTDSGTGLVHIAPAFGEDDYHVLQRERESIGESNLPLIHCVGPDGKFTSDAPEFLKGRWVKECDKDILRDLKTRKLLVHQTQYLHDYPFCWRAEQDPLIQYPRESWFIRTTACKDSCNKLVARAYSRRSDGEISRIQRRLGPEPRKILGNSITDMGV